MSLNDVEREITKDVVQRFLHENKPSPRKLLARRFRSSQAFYRLRDSGILANTAANAVTGEEVYLPRALAFYHCGDPDALKLARESVTIVIHALQNLFDAQPDKTRFTPEDLSAQADKIIEPRPEQDILKLGLYLAHDIGVLTTWFPGDATTEPEFFQIAESIVEIDNPNRAWDDFIARSTVYDDPAKHEVAGQNAEKDDLLPILRRKVFDQELKALGNSANESEPVSLLMLDLDHFKAVNDTHGHPVGDEVLIECANTVARRCRYKGKVYRFGGEEIAVLLPNFTVWEAVAVAESIRSEIEASRMSSKKLSITASIGVATAPVHATEGTKLLKAADEALYAAKRLGRNLVRIAVADPEIPTGDAQQQRLAPTGAGQTVEMTLGHQRLVCTAEHHNYRLTLTLRNISTTVIDSYHVDVLFPTGLLRKDVRHALELPSRRTATHSFFRVSTETRQVNVLYPGDPAMTMTIDYYTDRDVFHSHHEWLQQNVIATLYVKGSPPVSVQKPMSELQEF
jgi:diguanylate cyclase (GGDEF)-like protein